MKRYALYAVVFICVSAFIFAADAATVMIDPATQVSPSAGESITVNIKVENVTDMFGYQLGLAFDNTALKFSAIEEGEFLGRDGVSTFAFLDLTGQMLEFKDVTQDAVAEVNTAGVLSIVNTRYGDTTTVTGSGKLAAITFQVLEAKASTLELQNVTLADSDAEIITADSQNGAIEEPSGISGDVNGDGKVRSNDAILALRISAGLLIPSDEQKRGADMSGDGNVRSNDAILILRVAAGLAAPGLDAIAARTGSHITVALDEAHGIAGETITVPVKVDSPQGLAGGDICVSYNQSVLQAIEVLSDPDSLLASSLNNPGKVRIAFANANGVNSETVARIKFRILSDDSSPLVLETVEMYGPDARPLASKGIDEKFTSWAIPPEHSGLLQNFPNPFNPETWMPYQLKDAAEATIRIYNSAGELIRELDLGYRSPGLYVSKDRAAYWDGTNKFGATVASGVYFYSIRAGDFTAVRKLIILK